MVRSKNTGQIGCLEITEDGIYINGVVKVGIFINGYKIITDGFIDLVPRTSTDGFTVYYVGSGGMDIGTSFQWRTGSVLGDKTYTRVKYGWINLIEAEKLLRTEWVVTYIDSNDLVTRFIHFTKDTNSPPVETASHMGFKIVDGEIFASNADGVTQKITTTGVTIPTGDQRTILKISLNPGADCKFYVNGELKVTHTENLPTQGRYILSEGVTTNSAATRSMRAERFLIEKECS